MGPYSMPSSRWSGSAEPLAKANISYSCAWVKLLITGNPHVWRETTSQQSVRQANSLFCLLSQTLLMGFNKCQSRSNSCRWVCNYNSTVCFVFGVHVNSCRKKRKYHLYHFDTYFLDHFPGKTSYDVTVKHESGFLHSYNHLKNYLLRLECHTFCQVAGKHSPRSVLCSTPQALNVFWHFGVVFTRYFIGSVLILILLGNSCLIFLSFFITLTLGEIL